MLATNRLHQHNGASEVTGPLCKVLARSGSIGVNRGFRSYELTVIRALVLENRDLFLEKWNAYFDGK